MDRIAIIGFSARFPKSGNLSRYWENLYNKRCCITHFSLDELLAEGIPEKTLHSENYIRYKGCLDYADFFANEIFKIGSREALVLDPQFRVLLEMAHEALYSASINVESVKKTKVGIFSSSSSYSTYHDYFNSSFEAAGIEKYSAYLANGKDFLATFIAHKLGLTGPAINVQTACSSSLTAVCMACESLLQNNCSVAIAGGISINYPLKSGYLYKPGMIYSPTGLCQPFIREDSGVVPGDGGGLVVLKKLEDAIQDNDDVYAIIAGFGVNNDGRNKIGYTAPSIAGQAGAVKLALERASLDINELDYIECHGTGTKLGDEVELEALKQFSPSSCYIGSVKSNIGHLDAASGIAGLLKTVLSLINKTLLPTLYVNEINLSPAFKDSGLKPLSEPIELHDKEIIKAGVSSFGVGGTNAHVILESTRGPRKKNRQLPSLMYKSKQHTFLQSNRKRMYERCSYIPRWEKMQASNKPVSISNKSYLIFSDGSEFVGGLINQLRGRGACVRVITNGKVRELDGENISINFSKSEDIAFVIKEIQHCEPVISSIIFANFVDKCDVNDYTSVVSQGLIPIKEVVSTLYKEKEMGLYFITRGYYNDDAGSNSPSLSLISGILPVVELEYNHIKCCHLDYSVSTNVEDAPMALLIDMPEKTSIYIKEKEVYAKKYVPNDEAEAYRVDNGFRLNGTYVITGGLGGIGLSLAMFLAKNYKANLVLMSRRKVEKEKNWKSRSKRTTHPDFKIYLKLIEIKRHAGQLLVYSVDVSNSEKLSEVLNKVEVDFGEADGVIHAAGLAAGGALYCLNEKSIHEGMKAKVQGAINLYQFYKDKRLDFIIFCSALTALTGYKGQAIYCAANAFLDAFASYYNSKRLRLMSLNWDTWKEVGMAKRWADQLKKNAQKEECVSIEISSNEWFLTEHAVLGRSTLPGAAYTDLLLKTMDRGEKLIYPIEIKTLVFLGLMQPDEGKKSAIDIGFRSNFLSFENINFIYNDKSILSVSEMQLKKSLTDTEKNKLNIPAQFGGYDLNLSNRKIQLGDHWRCLDGVTIIGESHIAKIKMPNKYADELTRFYLHPSMLDMATSFFTTENYLPYQIERLVVYSKISSLIIYSKVTGVQKLCNRDIKVDCIEIFDKSGNLIMELFGYIFREMK